MRKSFEIYKSRRRQTSNAPRPPRAPPRKRRTYDTLTQELQDLQNQAVNERASLEEWLRESEKTKHVSAGRDRG
jgi:hypothetical protein